MGISGNSWWENLLREGAASSISHKRIRTQKANEFHLSFLLYFLFLVMISSNTLTATGFFHDGRKLKKIKKKKRKERYLDLSLQLVFVFHVNCRWNSRENKFTNRWSQSDDQILITCQIWILLKYILHMVCNDIGNLLVQNLDHQSSALSHVKAMLSFSKRSYTFCGKYSLSYHS